MDYLPFSDDEFRGLDAASAPEKLPEGFLTQADNCLIVGATSGRGGAIQTRPGIRAQLSAALGLEIGASTRYRTTGANTAVFSAGSTMTARIYRWDKGGTSTTVISPAGVFFDRSKVQMARLDSWIFITGALDGKLYRTDLTTFETATGLSTPTRTPSAVLTSRVLAPFTSPAGYDAAGGATAIPNSNFAGGVIDPPWTITGTVEAAQNIDPDNTGDWYVRMDDPPSFLQLTNALPNPLKTNTAGHGVGSGARRPVHFRVQFTHKAHRENESIVVAVLVYNTLTPALSDAPIAQLSRDYPCTPDTLLRADDVFSFADVVDDTAILSYRVEIRPGAQNRAVNTGPYFSFIAVTPVCPAPVLTVQNGSVTLQGARSGMGGDGRILLGGQWLTLDLGAAKDYSAISQIQIPYTAPSEIDGLQVRLGLRTGAAAAQVTSNQMTLFTDAAGGTFLTTDLSTIPKASRTAVRYLDLVFESDAALSGGVANAGQALLTLGSISEAGALSVGWADYAWRITETSGAGTTRLESGAGPSGVTVTPSQSQAQADVTLPAGGTFPENTGAKLRYYRRGGVPEVADDWRLVAEVSATANSSGPGWTWDFATRTFRDNVPDSTLLLAATLSDHIPPPTGAIAVAVFAGRLALGTSDGLYLSQQVVGAGVGLYYQSINDPLAPDYATQGFYTRVSGNEGASSGDSIQRLIPYLSRLWIFFQNSIFTFSGRNPGDFSLRRFEADGGKGCIAPGALVVYDQVIWCLASDGLRVLDGQTFTRVTGKIENLLNPEAVLSGTALDAAAYAKASLVAHAGRLYLSVPLPGQSVIGATYVLDSRAGAGEWVRWLLGQITGGFTFEGSADVNDLYVTSVGGQFYRIGNAYGDTATLGGAVSPVTLTVQGRKFTIPGQKLMALRFSATLECSDASPSADLTVFADNAPAGRTWTQTYSLSSGETNIDRLKVPSQVRGRGLQWRIAATTTQPIILRKAQLLAGIGESL